MKRLVLFSISLFIFCLVFLSNKEYSVEKKEEKQMSEKIIKEVKVPIFINKEVSLEYKTLEELYNWEYMYMFLYSNYMIKKNEDKPFFRYLGKIKKIKKDNLKIINKITKKQNVEFKKPTLEINGDINYFNNNINELYSLLLDVDSKKEMYKYLCITFNSNIYKFSELIKGENNLYNKYYYQEIIDNNIDGLMSINKTIGKIGLGSCCNLANVICPLEKKISYRNLNRFLTEKICKEKNIENDSFDYSIDYTEVNKYINKEKIDYIKYIFYNKNLENFLKTKYQKNNEIVNYMINAT